MSGRICPPYAAEDEPTATPGFHGRRNNFVIDDPPN